MRLLDNLGGIKNATGIGIDIYGIRMTKDTKPCYRRFDWLTFGFKDLPYIAFAVPVVCYVEYPSIGDAILFLMFSFFVLFCHVL